MQFKLRTLFILITACAMLIAASSLLPHPRSFWMGYDSKSQQAFDQIEAGQPKERALKLLGEPRATSPSFSREIAYCESDFKPAEIAQCCEFVVWRPRRCCPTLVVFGWDTTATGFIVSASIKTASLCSRPKGTLNLLRAYPKTNEPTASATAILSFGISTQAWKLIC
jgi:hypothetical protein